MEGKDTFHLAQLVSEGREVETCLCLGKRFYVSFSDFFFPAKVIHQFLFNDIFLNLFNHPIGIKNLCCQTKSANNIIKI